MEEGDVLKEEMLSTVEGPVAGGSGLRLETSALVEEVQGVRLGIIGELQALISAVKELTKVIEDGFAELKRANHLQRLVNKDRIEKIRKQNWRNYERTVRREL